MLYAKIKNIPNSLKNEASLAVFLIQIIDAHLYGINHSTGIRSKIYRDMKMKIYRR